LPTAENVLRACHSLEHLIFEREQGFSYRKHKDGEVIRMPAVDIWSHFNGWQGDT